MIRTATPAKAISVVLSTMIACTVSPCASVAFARGSEQADSIAASASSHASSETASAHDSSSDAAAAPVYNHESALSQGQALQNAATAVPDESIEMVSASVSVKSDAAMAVIAANGFNFAINQDDPATATCIGIAKTSAEGAVSIPATVALGDASYTVTNISTVENLGGGVRQF